MGAGAPCDRFVLANNVFLDCGASDSETRTQYLDWVRKQGRGRPRDCRDVVFLRTTELRT